MLEAIGAHCGKVGVENTFAFHASVKNKREQ